MCVNLVNGVSQSRFVRVVLCSLSCACWRARDSSCKEQGPRGRHLARSLWSCVYGIALGACAGLAATAPPDAMDMEMADIRPGRGR